MFWDDLELFFFPGLETFPQHSLISSAAPAPAAAPGSFSSFYLFVSKSSLNEYIRKNVLEVNVLSSMGSGVLIVPFIYDRRLPKVLASD